MSYDSLNMKETTNKTYFVSISKCVIVVLFNYNNRTRRSRWGLTPKGRGLTFALVAQIGVKITAGCLWEQLTTSDFPIEYNGEQLA